MGKFKSQRRLGYILLLTAVSLVFIKFSLDSPNISANYNLRFPEIKRFTQVETNISKNVFNNLGPTHPSRVTAFDKSSSTAQKSFTSQQKLLTSLQNLATSQQELSKSQQNVAIAQQNYDTSQHKTVTSSNSSKWMSTKNQTAEIINPTENGKVVDTSKQKKPETHRNPNGVLNPKTRQVVAKKVHPNHEDYINILTKRIQPVDLMKAGPFDFLPKFRNPCFEITNKSKADDLPIQCFPYFYLMGAPKAGTTDLFSRLVHHPEISQYVTKEPHWLTRKRFYSVANFKPQPDLDNYLHYFRGASRHITGKKTSTGYHPIVVGDCSASTMWDNDYWVLLPEFRNLSEPVYTNSDYIHHINPNTKFIAMIRNPIDRLYSDYLYFTRGKKSPELFHEKAVEVVNQMNTCLQNHTLRQCLYTPADKPKNIRLRIGVYHQHIKEYLRVFPPSQILIVKMEDYSKHTAAYLEKVFAFLGVSALSPEKLKTIATTTKHANTRRAKDQEIGDMLPDTRQLLGDFYKFHNDELGRLLGEQYNYNYF